MSFNLKALEEYCDHPLYLEEVYEAALEASKRLPSSYIFLETGTRSGGSALAILQAIEDSGINRWLFTVDPYGMKPYNVGDEVVGLDYGEDHYRRAMKVLAEYAFDHKLLHSHFRMKSIDWMRAFDNSEFWFEERKMAPKFGFAYLDGDHDSRTVRHEYIWLKNHTEGVSVVVDDAHYLDENILKLGTLKHNRLFIGAGDGNG
jgi:predicted O-methyltransferase YrrM